MRQNMFTVDRGDRGSAPNIGVVVTDGESNRDKGKTIPYADEAKLAGITMIAVGVGKNTVKSELQGIATNSSFVFSADNFEALTAIQAKIVDAACDVPVSKSLLTVLNVFFNGSSVLCGCNFDAFLCVVFSVSNELYRE